MNSLKALSVGLFLVLSYSLSAQQEITVRFGTDILTSGASTLDFETIFLEDSTTNYLIIENVGTANLTLGATDAVSLGGTHASLFSIDSDNSGDVLAEDDIIVIPITFKPMSIGSKTATVTIISDDVDEGSFNFTVNGTAQNRPSSCTIPSFEMETFSHNSVSAAFVTVVNTYRAPTGWTPVASLLLSALSGTSIHVDTTNDARTGSTALELRSDDFGDGDVITIFPCATQPTALKGYYKFSGAVQDSAAIIVSTAGAVAANITDANSDTLYIMADASSYTEFNLNIGYDVNSKDSLRIYLGTTSNGANISFKIDDLELVASAPPLNTSPTVVSPIADKKLQVGEAVTIDLKTIFGDADGDDLTFLAPQPNTSVLNVAILNTSNLVITPKKAGLTEITVQAKDDDGNTVIDVFNVSINQPPTLSFTLGRQRRSPGFKEFKMNLAQHFKSSTGQTLTYAVVNTNESLITASILEDSLIVIENDSTSSTANLIITATDQNEGKVSDTLTVFVNHFPTVTNPIPAQFFALTDGPRNIDLTSTYSDPEGDQITYSIINNDTAIVSVSLETINNIVTLTPKKLGSAIVSYRAKDDGFNFLGTSFQVTVNTLPIIEKSVNDFFFEPSAFSSLHIDLDTIFSDPDGHELSYVTSSSDFSVADITLNNNILSISRQGHGQSLIGMSAYDELSGSVSDTFSIIFNTPPSALYQLTNKKLFNGFGTDEIILDSAFWDSDGDEISHTAVSSDTSILDVDIAGRVLILREKQIGTAEVTVFGMDKFEGISSMSFIVEIQDVTTGLYNDLEQRIQVYPNPTEADITISGRGPFLIKINDLAGNLLLESILKGDQKISTRTLESGIFLLTVIHENNKRMETFRILKK